MFPVCLEGHLKGLSCICLLAMHTLICLTFSLPPGVRAWLRRLLVALSGVFCLPCYMGRVKRIWYLLPVRAAKVQASLRIRAVSPEPSLLAHTSSESRGTFRLKARSLAPLNGWACAVKICHDGMLEDTNSLGGAHICNEQALSLKFWLRGMFETYINLYKVVTFHPITIKFCLYILYDFLSITKSRLTEKNIFSKKDFILQMCVKLWPITRLVMS